MIELQKPFLRNLQYYRERMLRFNPSDEGFEALMRTYMGTYHYMEQQCMPIPEEDRQFYVLLNGKTGHAAD